MSGNSGGNIRPIIPMMMGMGMNPMMQNMNPNPGMMNPMFSHQIPPQMVPQMTRMNMPHPQMQGMPMPNMMQGMPQMPMMMNPMNPMMMNPMMAQAATPKPPTGERKVWVSHIPPSLSDTFMLKLLESCGVVNSWKRTTDQNGRPKGFGFCEYTTVESILKALRLLNHLKLEEGYELAIKVDTKVEEYLKIWREGKKQEWIDNLRRRGVEVNLEDIKKRENNREPLEWELQLVSKDNETRKLIFDILTQKNEIEMYAKQNEKPEEFLKDLKDLTTHNTFSVHFESEREKIREKRKAEKIIKMEKTYKDEEKKWEAHEEDMERKRKKEIHDGEDLIKRKKKIIERDLNYDSEEEKSKRVKKNDEIRTMREMKEIKKIRDKEKEFDNLMRKKENPSYKDGEIELDHDGDIIMNNEVTDLVLVDNQLQGRDQESKTMITYKEYQEEQMAEGEEEMKENLIIQPVNIDTKKGVTHKSILKHDEDDYDFNDLYNKKQMTRIEINPETEKEILEMKNEIINYNVEEDNKYLKGVGLNSNINLNYTNESYGKEKVNSNISNTTTNAEKSKQLLELHKQIYEQIPKKNEELLKYPINWNIVSKYDILENKIKPWLGKKLIEYIGEDEPNLKGMIIKKLAMKSSPYELIEKIKAVFEEDTEDFVTKLWRNFIFEILKATKLQNL